MLHPKISILTVVFNAGKTVEETIKSILSQTYANWELIIIDGGSTDETINILKRYNSPRITWQSEPDKGIYDAMNKGIRIARGEWIYFLGADDTFYNNRELSEVFGETSYLESDLIYGNVFKNNKKDDGKFNRDKILKRNICHQGIFYRKSIHDRIGGYNIDYKLFADWDFNLRCFFDGTISIKYVDKIIANFAEGGASSGNDDYSFFRNSLFPYSLLRLNETGVRSLWNIARYDRWWRLIRSMKLIDDKDDITKYTREYNLPSVIKKMYSFQKKIPYSLVRNGVISKTAMLLSYCFTMPFSKLK